MVLFIYLILNSVVGFAAFVLPVAIVLIGGARARSQVRHEPISARPDLEGAKSYAAGLGILAGLAGAGALGFAAAIGSGWTGSVNLLLVLAFGALGALAGPIVWLAGILGYAVLARRRPNGTASGGAIAGPVLLVSAIALGSWTAEALGNAEGAARMGEQEAREEAWRVASASLHVRLDDVDVHQIDFADQDTGAPRTGIDTARVTLVLLADIDLPLAGASGPVEAGRLELIPNDPPLRGCVLDAEVPSLGASITAGQALRIPLTLAVPAGCASQPAPGPFTLSLSLFTITDGVAGGYGVTFPVSFPG